MAMHAQPFGDPNETRGHAARAPFFVSVFNPVGRFLAGRGLMGPNALLTVRGRKSGLERTTPVAYVEVDGRRCIIGTFGQTNWVRNLRAAGDATITIKGRPEAVRAVVLSPTEAARFFREELTVYVNRLLPGRLILRMLGAADILTDPDGAAQRRSVFELKPVASDGGRATPLAPESH